MVVHTLRFARHHILSRYCHNDHWRDLLFKLQIPCTSLQEVDYSRRSHFYLSANHQLNHLIQLDSQSGFVRIASIGGSPKTTVECEVSIVESCITCNASNDIVSALQKQVTSNFSEKVECRDFLASVQTLAQQTKVTSLASIEVEKFSDL